MSAVPSERARRFKQGLGLVLGVAIGAFCRALNIPSPAPPVLAGAALVVAMTLGYLATDRFCTRAARHRGDCGGPDGHTHTHTQAARPGP